MLTTENPGLRADGISVSFGGVRVLSDIAITVEPREIVGLIGPNGAGKTTLVNVLSGFQPASGSLQVDGTDLPTKSPARRSRAGLRRTFQNIRLFESMSVRENIEVSALGVGCSVTQARHQTGELLDWCNLADQADLLAPSLSYGQERGLAIARALVGNPRYVMLDEPAAGMDEDESDELLARLQSVPDRFGCGLLVIEHDMRLIMRLCDRLQMIDYGTTVIVGTPDEVRRDPRVLEAYLGQDHAVAGEESDAHH
jgi:branched-chain amino acid transport system ATP-binding protein